MIPSCSHTGTPLHFHSSTTSGSACLMSSRMRASVSPRQSSSSPIRASISSEGEFVFVMWPFIVGWWPPMSEENVQTVQLAFEAIRSRDIEALLQVYDADIEFLP